MKNFIVEEAAEALFENVKFPIQILESKHQRNYFLHNAQMEAMRESLGDAGKYSNLENSLKASRDSRANKQRILCPC